MENLFRFLSSKILSLSLFGILVVLLLPTTFVSEPLPALDFINRVVLGFLVANIVCCTLYRWRKLRISTIVIHMGCVLTVSGSLISSLFGYVATVNVHEESSTDIAYRWDLQEDTPLGFQLDVKNIQKEYYPTPLKVGVLKEGEKHELFEILTGENFTVDGYQFNIDTLDVEKKSIDYTIIENSGTILGSFSTDITDDLSLPPISYQLQLVAYKDPTVKRVWTELTISEGDTLLAEGTSEVNAPFIWNGLKFHHTLTGRDPFGFDFAGIQIVKDPGVPYVYFGFVILCLGLLLSLKKILRPAKRK